MIKQIIKHALGGRPARVHHLACASAVVLSCLVLAGWALDLERLKRLFPTSVAMNPTTAVGLVLLSISLWRSSAEQAQPTRHISAKLCAGLITVVGLIKITEALLGWTSGVDQILFANKLTLDPSGQPNRMAPNTALNFVLLGCALLCLDKKPRRSFYIPDAFTIVAIFGSLLPIIGYLYGTKPFYGIGNFIPMAPNTAASFLFLGIGVLSARPGRGLTVTIIDKGVSGVMVRRLLPAAIGFPIILGWLRLGGQRLNYYDNEMGAALMVVAQILLFTTLLLWNSFLFLKLDTMRRHVEGRLQELTLTDDLTGLRNRRGFYLLADRELKLAPRLEPGIGLWCIYADLDGLKMINDTLGHEIGSRAITRTAAILKETFRETDIIARLGGDEFVVLAAGNAAGGGSHLADRLQGNLGSFNVKGLLPCRLSLSVGLVRVDTSRIQSVDDLLVKADQAMYENKNRKKSVKELKVFDLQSSGRAGDVPPLVVKIVC